MGRDIVRATMCYMESITHREMRNNSAELLRRVEAGESVIITNRGRPTAVISPVPRRTLDELLELGEGRPAQSPLSGLRSISRGTSERAASQLLDDARGRW